MSNDLFPGEREAVWEAVQGAAKRDPVWAASFSKVAKAKVALNKAELDMKDALTILKSRGILCTTMGSGIAQTSGAVGEKQLLDMIDNNPEFLKTFGASREL